VYFALSAANLALYERELGKLTSPGEMISAGVMAGPLQERVRGGAVIPPADPQSDAPTPQPSGELARGIARHSSELEGLVQGRRVEDVAYIEVADLTRVVAGELNQSSPDGPATLLAPGGIIELTPGSRSARRNFQPLTLDQAPMVVDGKLYISIKELEKLADAQVTWSEQRRRFAITSGGTTIGAIMLEDMFEIEIDRSGRTLATSYLGHRIANWGCCVGAGGNTPVGIFHIQNKAQWAGWRAYWGEYIPGGSRRNPLGARWLGTSAHGRETGRAIGIHGTNQPSSIGRRISGGCIRLTNAHAIEAYDTIPIGSRVVIHE